MLLSSRKYLFLQNTDQKKTIGLGDMDMNRSDVIVSSNLFCHVGLHYSLCIYRLVSRAQRKQ